jgi:dihydrofolate reductase
VSDEARGGAGRSAAKTRLISLVLVAAVAENGVIGRDNTLPWRLRSDLRRFRARTEGKPVVMGRKTFLSVGKPLSGRTNIVISRDRNFSAPGVVVAPELRVALEAARGDALRRGVEEIAVIGGAEIYAQTLPIADRLDITLVNARPEGNVRFPPIDPQVWREVERSEHAAGPEDGADYSFITYERAARKADQK